MASIASSVGWRLADALWAPVCPLCRQRNPEHFAQRPCAACYDNCQRYRVLDDTSQLQAMQEIRDQIGLSNLTAFVNRSAAVSDWLYTIKYGRSLSAAHAIASLMAAQSADLLTQPDDRQVFLVPIPIPLSRYVSRGFNLPSILAQSLADSLEVTTIPLLTAPLFRRTSASLSRNQRLRQSHRFGIDTRYSVPKDAHIVLIDDVLTTGTTLARACQVVRRTFPATEVSGLVFARA